MTNIKIWVNCAVLFNVIFATSMRKHQALLWPGCAGTQHLPVPQPELAGAWFNTVKWSVTAAWPVFGLSDGKLCGKGQREPLWNKQQHAGVSGLGGHCSNLTGKQRETHHDKTHKKIISRGSLEYPASTSYFSQWRIGDVIVAVCTTSLHPAETSQGSQKPSTSGCKGAWEG